MPDFEWHGDDILDQLTIAINDAILETADAVLVPAIMKTLSIQGPPPSVPFTPPHRQTDEAHDASAEPGVRHLQESIAAWVENGAVLVGCENNIYGLYLEIGTQEMSPRPWLMATLEDNAVRDEFVRFITAKVQTKLGTIAGTTPATP